MIVQRFDRQVLRRDRLTRMASGALLVDARPARTGIQIYRKADGTPYRELRLPEDVFDASSLASYKGVPVTIQHPDSPVTPETWASVAKGHVVDVGKPDGDHVSTPLCVQAADAIAGVDSGDLIELSCGYSCELDPTPGEYQGQKYDAIQRKITLNHVALLHRGEARAGPTASLRFDSNSAAWADSPTEETAPMAKEKIDGKEYDVGTPEWAAAFRAHMDAEVASAKKALADAKDPKAIAALVKAQATFLREAKCAARGAAAINDCDLVFDADETAAAVEGGTPSLTIVRQLLSGKMGGIDVAKASDDFVLGAFSAFAMAGDVDEAEEADPAASPPAPDAAPAPPRMDSFGARSAAGRPGLERRAPREDAEPSLAQIFARKRDSLRNPQAEKAGKDR